MRLDEFTSALDDVLAAETLEEVLRASPHHTLPIPVSQMPSLGVETIHRQLLPDETIMWVGRPESNWQALLPILPAAMFMGCFEVIATVSGPSPFFITWGAFIFLFMVRKPLSRIVNARRTVYAITTKRIVRVVRRGRQDHIDTVPIRALTRVSVQVRPSGLGTITFPAGSGNPSSSRSRSRNAQGSSDALSLINVPDASAIARLIGSIQTQAGQPQLPQGFPE